VGTVREDYSANGDSWNYLPHDHARSRAYRWGEDGLLGITDRECRLCFALALWNGRDSILKERLFGLTNTQGNHGEDVKECYFYLDATPTHSYMKALYKYPQAAFPYDGLRAENQRRGRNDPEFELTDTGVFEGNLYFDVFAEYAKASPDDLLIRLTICNRGPDAAELHLLLHCGSATPGRGDRTPTRAAGRSRSCTPSTAPLSRPFIARSAASFSTRTPVRRENRRRCCSRKTKRTFSGSSVRRTEPPTSRTPSTSI